MTLVVRKLRKGVHGGDSCSTGTTVSELAFHSSRWHWTGEEGRSTCSSRLSVLTQDPEPPSLTSVIATQQLLSCRHATSYSLSSRLTKRWGGSSMTAFSKVCGQWVT